MVANNATSPQLYENKWTEQDFCYTFPLNEHLTLTFEALKAFVNVCLAVSQKFFVALSNAVWDLVFVLMYEGRTCVVFRMRVDWLRHTEGQSYFCTLSKVTASDGRKPVHTHTHTRQCQHNSSQITVYLTHCLTSLLAYCVHTTTASAILHTQHRTWEYSDLWA